MTVLRVLAQDWYICANKYLESALILGAVVTVMTVICGCTVAMMSDGVESAVLSDIAANKYQW